MMIYMGFHECDSLQYSPFFVTPPPLGWINTSSAGLQGKPGGLAIPIVSSRERVRLAPVSLSLLLLGAGWCWWVCWCLWIWEVRQLLGTSPCDEVSCFPSKPSGYFASFDQWLGPNLTGTQGTKQYRQSPSPPTRGLEVGHETLDA